MQTKTALFHTVLVLFLLFTVPVIGQEVLPNNNATTTTKDSIPKSHVDVEALIRLGERMEQRKIQGRTVRVRGTSKLTSDSISQTTRRKKDTTNVSKNKRRDTLVDTTTRIEDSTSKRNTKLVTTKDSITSRTKNKKETPSITTGRKDTQVSDPSTKDTQDKPINKETTPEGEITTRPSNEDSKTRTNQAKEDDSTSINSTEFKTEEKIDGQPITVKETGFDGVKDTINTVQDSIRIKPETLTDKVVYKATDYQRISQRKKKIYLYNEAEIVYEDMKINAGEIILDYETNTVFAKGIKDSAGGYSQIPIFIQGPNEVKPDSIKFNFDSQRALIYGSRVEKAGGQQINLKAERSKRVNDSVVFMSNVKITTSEDLDNPEYYFYARRVKFVPGKKLVAGLTNMYIADVPTPIGIPFAFFPMEKEKSVSGFLIPGPGESRERGYSLTGGGYYFALSDYFDLTLRGDYYTNGSYGFNAETLYKVRYKFSGQFSFNSERILFSERGFSDFSETNTYNIRWNHSQDTKSSPNSRFSASVNLGSSNFFQQSLNQANTGNFLNNNFSSSVSYSRTFPGTVPVNVTMAATHSQNSQTEQITMSLPTTQVNVDRIYPFAGKSGSKKGLINNLNLSYALRADNRFRTNDDEFFTAEMFEGAETGIRHSIPLTTNFKIFNYISASINGSLEESWVFKTIEQSWDQDTNAVVRDTVSGFDAYRTYRGGVSLGTTVYGTFNFKEKSKIQTIRHVVRPSVGWSYTPAYNQFYDSYTRTDPDDASDPTLDFDQEYSRFEGGFFGAPGNRISNSLSFSLANTLEAKVRSKDSTDTEPKKIKLINNLNFRTSYNFAADNLKLSPISMSGSIPVIQEKLDINFSANLDIYALNSANQRINTLNINNGGSLFRLTSGQSSFGYRFSSKDFDKDKDKDKGRNTDRTENQTFAGGGRPDDLLGQGVDITGNSNVGRNDDEEEEEKEVQFYRFKVPWNLRFGYQIGYANNARQREISTHSIVVSGDVKLGNRWSIGGSTGYDLANPGITFTSLNFARDLESWNMTFSWVPPVNANVSRTSWNFFIGIKGNLLSDIKYDKRRTPDQRL